MWNGKVMIFCLIIGLIKKMLLNGIILNKILWDLLCKLTAFS